MKYYPKYKDSNINWAMSIPATWKVQKIKYGLLFRQGGAWGTDPADNEFDCPCIRVADFDYAHLCVLDREYTVRNYSTAQIEKLTLSYGDLLIEKSGGGETTPVGRVVIYDKKSPALYANFLEALRVKENQSSSFYKYISKLNINLFINYDFQANLTIKLGNYSDDFPAHIDRKLLSFLLFDYNKAPSNYC